MEFFDQSKVMFPNAPPSRGPEVGRCRYHHLENDRPGNDLPLESLILEKGKVDLVPRIRFHQGRVGGEKCDAAMISSQDEPNQRDENDGKN